MEQHLRAGLPAGTQPGLTGQMMMGSAMNRTADADKPDDPSAAGLSRCLAPLLSVLITVAGCTAPTATREASPAAVADAKVYRATGIRIRLIEDLRAGDRGTLLESPGWVEYVFAIDNTGSSPLRLHDVKLLNADGRYLASAAPMSRSSPFPMRGAEWPPAPPVRRPDRSSPSEGRSSASSPKPSPLPPPNPEETPNRHSNGTSSKPSSWHRQGR